MMGIVSAFAEDGSFYVVCSNLGTLCYFDRCVICLYKVDWKTSDV